MLQESQRGREISEGILGVAKRLLREFSAEYNYNLTIETDGAVLCITLLDKSEQKIADADIYERFMNQFRLYDPSYEPYVDEFYTRKTIRVTTAKNGLPCLEVRPL